MELPALLDPWSLFVLAADATMLGVSVAWWIRARGQHGRLVGRMSMLRDLVPTLSREHPVRKRLEASPVAELSFEEIAALMRGRQLEQPARVLLQLGERAPWIDRFAQFAVHLGILGTVTALATADATDLQGFRAALPRALGTTFWGLIGALALSVVAGSCDALLASATRIVREALIEGSGSPGDAE